MLAEGGRGEEATGKGCGVGGTYYSYEASRIHMMGRVGRAREEWKRGD
jgi:hypothetical protein